MLKLGLVRPAHLDRPRTWYGARKFPSLYLLRDLRRDGAANATRHDDILRLLQMANGTWKETRRGRFEGLDRDLVGLLLETHPRGGSLIVTDLAVSSGVTSVELYRALSTVFRPDFLATDLWRDAIAFRRIGRPWSVVLDFRGEVVQYVLGPFVLPGFSSELPLYPINALLRFLARLFLLPGARRLLPSEQIDRCRDFDHVSASGYDVMRLPLLSADTLDLMEAQHRFRFEVADVLEPMKRPADLIRAMNILTPLHMPAPALRHAARNCLANLNPGGIFVIGRSVSDDPDLTRATVYRRDDGALVPVRRLNGGAEIERLVEEEWRHCAQVKTVGSPGVTPA